MRRISQPRLFFAAPPAACVTLLFWALAGCHTGQAAPRVGADLPVSSSRSVALPGAVDAADAPSSPSVAEPHADNLATYRDAAHGVSFRYPAVWRPAQTGGGTFFGQPDFASVAPQPIVTQMFTSDHNVYADTVLQSLSFSYTVKKGSTAAACAALPAAALQSPANSTRTVQYNGRTFQEASGGDAGMCHQLRATVDSTLQGSQCFLFERDTMTTCPYVKTQTTPRPLTPAEDRALQRHLDAIMQSVTITPAS